MLGPGNGAAGPVAAALRRERIELRERKGAERNRLPEGFRLRKHRVHVGKLSLPGRQHGHKLQRPWSSMGKPCGAVHSRSVNIRPLD